MSQLDNIVKQLQKAGYTAHRTTSEINCKIANRSVYIATSRDNTLRISLMGKGQHALAMHMVNATSGTAPHVTQYLNSWGIAPDKLLSTLKAVDKAAATHRATYCK